MKTDPKTENNLDEVIFEKRNKAYGAYFLRKKYNSNLSAALTLSITFILLIVAIPLIANYIQNEKLIRSQTTVSAELIKIDHPKDETKPPLPPPPPNLNTKKLIFLVPKIVSDTTDQGNLFTQDELKQNYKNDGLSDTTLKVDDNQDDKKIIDIDQDNTIHNITGISEKPEFPGGDEGLYLFISDNIKYPDLAREINIQGTVFMKFVVEKDGTVSSVKVFKGIGAGCDEEAERVLKMMPKWTPGKQNNKEVRVEVMVPIKFMIVH